MSSAALSLLGWAFLPDLVTNYGQIIFYAFWIRAGERKPTPGSPLHATHRRRIYALVIVVYLLYILYEAHWEIRRSGDFYADLGVPVDVEDRALQTKFRRLTLQFHPDKLPPGERAAAEAYYIHLKLARDTLIDPAKRFAYDRFGPDVVEWQGLVTFKEYIYMGLKTRVMWYFGGVVLLMTMGLFGFGQWGGYWRYLGFAALAAFELRALTSPSFPSLLPHAFLPEELSFLTNAPRLQKVAGFWASSFPYLTRPYLPFQTLQLAHKASIAFFIALSRLGPILEQSVTGAPAPPTASKGKVMEQLVERLDRITGANVIEASRLLALETVPFQNIEVSTPLNPPESGTGAGQGQAHAQLPGLALLQARMRDWLVTNTVRNDPAVKAAFQKVIQRRREGAGATNGHLGGEMADARNANVIDEAAGTAVANGSAIQGAGSLGESFADLSGGNAASS